MFTVVHRYEFLYQGTNSKHPSVLVLVRNPVTTVFFSATNCDVGLTIVSDLRCSNPDSIKRLLTSLNCAQRLHAPCIHVAYVIVDRISQALVFASSAFKPHGRVRVSQTTPKSCVQHCSCCSNECTVSFQIELVSSLEALKTFVSLENLPLDFTSDSLLKNHHNFIDFLKVQWHNYIDAWTRCTLCMTVYVSCAVSVQDIFVRCCVVDAI